MKSLSSSPSVAADRMAKRRNTALITIGEPFVEIGSMNYVGEDLTCTTLWQLVDGWLRVECRLTRTKQGEWVAVSNPEIMTLPFNPKWLVDAYWLPGLGTRASSQLIHTLAVEEYRDDFLVLTLFSGEGPQLRLFRIGMLAEGKWAITHVADGHFATSMGFSVNRISDGSETILFGDLKSSTWIPAIDQRKATDYHKMTVTLEDLTNLTGDLGQGNGYIVVVDSVSPVKEVNLFNGPGELVSSLNDLVAYGHAISDVRWMVCAVPGLMDTKKCEMLVQSQVCS